MANRKKSIVLLVPSLRKNDAIGNDVYHQYRACIEAGYDVRVFCEDSDSQIDVVRCDIEFTRKCDCLLLHYGSSWESGLDHFATSESPKKLVKYHNITPAVFFECYNKRLSANLAQARAQLKTIINHATHILSDSIYNKTEIASLSKNINHHTILPPFVPLDDGFVAESTSENYRRLPNRYILAIGRIAPNKGLHHYFHIARTYNTQHSEALQFVWIGKSAPDYYLYKLEMEALLKASGAEAYVTILEDVDDPAELKSLLRGALAFCIPSEHEGFAVPVIEAQRCGTPVIGFDAGAIKETAGANQIILPVGDYAGAISAIRILDQHPEVRDQIVEYGKKNADIRFSHKEAKAQFLKLLDTILKG